MKTIIAGGRDKTLFIEHMDDIVSASGIGVSEVVSGAARGVDASGEQWAKHARVPVKRFPADWNAHGKAADPIRNGQMARYADALILIWNGKSRGSANMLKQATDAGLVVYQHLVEGE